MGGVGNEVMWARIKMCDFLTVVELTKTLRCPILLRFYKKQVC